MAAGGAALRRPGQAEAEPDVALSPRAQARPSGSAPALMILISHVALRNDLMVPSYVALGCLLPAQQSQRAWCAINDLYGLLAVSQMRERRDGQVGRLLHAQEREHGLQVAALGPARACHLGGAQRHAGTRPGPGVPEPNHAHAPALAAEVRHAEQQPRLDPTL